MANAENIVTGGWQLEGDSRWRWLYTELQVNVLYTLLGIIVTLALPRIVKLLLHMYNLAARYNINHQRHWHGPRDVYDTNITIEHAIWEYCVDTLDNLRLAFSQIRLPNNGASRPVDWSYAWKAFKRLVTAAILAIIFIGTIVAGVMVVNLALDNLALSSHPDCGLYMASDTSDLVRTTIPFEFGLEADSAKYMADCYGDESSTTSPSCNIFKEKNLPFEVTDNVACPFEETMCHLGPSTAYSLATPPISARMIGINTRRRIEFKREAIFTPLNMSDDYITIDNDSSTYTVSYKYGLSLHQGADPNLTWQTFTHGDSVGKDASYSLAAIYYNSSATNDGDVGPPIAQLRTAPGDLLTILLNLPGKIYHMKPSIDPIFPTNAKEVHIPGLSGSWWTYTSGWARPLAVIDRIKWRNLDEGSEWHDILEQPPVEIDGSFPGDLWLMWWAIKRSHTWGSIGRRLGNGWLAQARINGFVSLPLDAEQWKIEALQLFKTSLARVQLEAYYYARGVYAKDPAYVKLDFNLNFCDGTYVFNAEGYRNLYGTPWLSILLGVIFMIILSLPYSREHEPEWLLGSKLVDVISGGNAERLAFWFTRCAGGLLYAQG